MSPIPPLPSNFGPFDPSRDIGLFNPSLPCPDSETRQFNDVTSFLRNLEHCQGLYRYRRTKLLEYMLWALNGPAWEWFKKRSHFNSLPRFGMALTKAFPSQEQRELESIAQKRAKRKARKTAERAELNGIKTAKQTPTLQDLGIFDPSLASDRTEFGLYSNAATFLQHLEQCQHLYRKSDLLNLLPKCLCGHASDWFKTQSEFTSLKRFSKALTKAFPKASVRRTPRSSNLQLSTLDVISESIETSSDSETTSARVTCKLCKQSFNSNKELYQHIRNHEALKPVNDSHLSINAVNLVCETKETSPASHKSSAPPAIQKPVNQSAVASEAVTLLKRSALQPLALETAPEPTERLSACRHCKQTFNSKEMLRQHKREQHAKRSAVSSHLSIDAAKSARESTEISTVNSTLPLPASLGTFNPTRPHQDLERKRFNQAATFIQHLQECQHLYRESELLDWLEVVLYGPADTWFRNQPDFTSLHDFGIALTKAFPTSTSNTMFVSPLPIPTAKSTYETKEKPAVMNSPASQLQASTATPKQKFESAMTSGAVTSSKESHLSSIAPEIVPESVENKSTQWSTPLPRPEPSPRTFESELQETSVQKVSDTCSPLSNNTANSTSEAAGKSAITCPPPPQEPPTPPATPRNLITDTITPLQSASPDCSSLPIATSKITSKCMESTSVSSTEPAEAAKATKDSLAEIRTQAARIRVRLEAERAALQLSALEPAPKSMERLPIQQTACARICRRCKRSFNSNNKLHEHIREHHARRPGKSLNLRASAPGPTCEVKEKSAFTCPPAPLAPPTPPTTPRSQISSAEIASQSLSPKCSNLPIATYKISSKPMENAAANCPLTPPSTPPLGPVRKHQEPRIQKSYLTVDDLSRMFAGNPRPFGLRQHHNRRPSPQSFGLRQPGRPCSTPSKRPHLTIENLFEMFDGRSGRKGIFQGQNNVSSQASSDQMQITAYFKPAANQKSLISQGLKSSKSKSLDQHMPAESIRIAFSRSLPEKLADLPCKMPDVSGGTPSFISILLRLLLAFLLALAFVSAISAARMGCISAYQQAVSAIGRAIQ